MKITIEQLQGFGACENQVRLFKQLFGDSVEVTEELAAKHAAVFDWTRAARLFLSDPALAEYKRVEAPAWAEYERVRALALAEYWRVEAPAMAEYCRVTAPAWAEYWRVKAVTFARLYNGEGE